MLQQLVAYAHREGLEVEPGFRSRAIRWAVAFDAEGQFLDVVELGDASLPKNPGRELPRCPDLSQAELVSGSTTRCHFLAETAEVVALLGKNGEEQKTREKHNHFVWLLKEAGGEVAALAAAGRGLAGAETVAAVRGRLERARARPADKVTVQVGGELPLEGTAWHAWWRAYRGRLTDRKPAAGRVAGGDGRMRCLVTGRLVEPAATHPKIAGLQDVGGLTMGNTLVGFDKEAFGSYGLQQSANAAMSAEATAAYRAALEHLLRERGRRLAGAKITYWFDHAVPEADDPLPWLMDSPTVAERDAHALARGLLDSIRAGARPDLAGNRYRALALSGAGGRVMVRDWMEGAFEELAGAVAAWLDDLAIVARDGNGLAPPPKLFTVLAATVRDPKELTGPGVARMWRVAVRQEPLPATVLAQALARTRMDVIEDQPFNHARMALLKAYHVRQRRLRGGSMPEVTVERFLNEQHPHPAYHAGRLMALLAALQRAALGHVGAGVVQRYYAAASATPALVLGRLTRTSQFHLNKLEGGLAYWYETRLAEVWSRIRDQVPATLTLEEQSLFALGYYQQLADLQHKKKDDSHE
ncbi:MAG: type I-C CRISPR-associated protein Cas8c/Csd1 [Candidatus Schekmanbacteria bacterium]|nr:type I-C CRISPR-associated protein Cas8c/Csd1 [Candidatus Schekmanbacteria bacterium]